MTARKRAAKKKSQKSALERIEDELPANLRDYVKKVHRQLNALERDVERAVPQARRRTARLIREASHQLGALEERGQKAWSARADHMTKDAQKLLRKLGKAVAPPAKRGGKKKSATRKKAAGKKKAAKKRSTTSKEVSKRA